LGGLPVRFDPVRRNVDEQRGAVLAAPSRMDKRRIGSEKPPQPFIVASDHGVDRQFERITRDAVLNARTPVDEQLKGVQVDLREAAGLGRLETVK